MAKKKQKSPNPKGWLVSKKQVENWLTQASDRLLTKDYEGVLRICQRLLRYLPPKVPERADTLEYMGSAYLMQHRFEEGYRILSQALEIAPQQGRIWYNRALAAQLTMRMAQSLFDMEKAVKLEKDPALQSQRIEQLTQFRRMAESERALRGPDFTLEQLREQQELFIHGNELMEQGHWSEAEAIFRQVIERGDCHPQPWGNLGISLLMQRRFDEAERAYKRALKIDPDYDLALHNLALLPSIRQSGNLPQFSIRDPMDNVKISLNVQTEDDD